MSDYSAEFETTPIGPVDCLTASKDLIGDQYWLYLGISVVGILIGSAVPLGILMGPMMCGIYYCFFRRMRGEPVEFAMLFKGFDYFVESLVATLIVVGITIAAMLPFVCVLFAGMIGFSANAPGHAEPAGMAMFGVMALFYVLVLAASLLISVFIAFAYPLIVDRGMKAAPALGLSFRAAKANFGGMLGLVALMFLISIVAALCCYVPALLVMPFQLGALALAYRKVFPELPLPPKTA